MPWPKRSAQSKYGNEIKKDSLCYYGFYHRSKLERSICDQIRLEELAGEIEHMAHEDTVYLSKARYRYIPDFKLRRKSNGEIFWREAKGYGDKRWPTTKKLWKHYGFGRLEVWGGHYRRPVLEKVIITEGLENGEGSSDFNPPARLQSKIPGPGSSGAW